MYKYEDPSRTPQNLWLDIDDERGQEPNHLLIYTTILRLNDFHATFCFTTKYTCCSTQYIRTDARKALIFLNSADSTLHPLFKGIWVNSFVDGFANQVFCLPDKECYIPDFVTGDFDSISGDALSYYRSQDKPAAIAVVHMSGGRLDHEFGLIQTLYEAHRMNSIPVHLVSECCVSILLPAGMHQIHTNTGLEADHCGLVPVGAPSLVTTTGLKWNLRNQLLSFGHLVSTSNQLAAPLIEVTCDSPLLMILEYKR
ncbi:hypothetical protein T265_01198 [Opisthorchis viverrini]|uniref:Thiamin pyrophosphokinase thiamin-binding domain-containing protein n=1 Tax=Opisthorchis viverrini TaxID=6198 RepID=A0A075A063_OPIVI|nr:hypothetical protein T265_01198 [Opisthorchis viverrini]KER32706.1 hypothetical protein T265_01198 [Opisthorchis viverrini]